MATMGKRVRPYATMSAQERLGLAVARLPEPAQRALAVVADREDLPLIAGTWNDGAAGCLVANVVATIAADGADEHRTLDVRVLELIPELSSRDFNRLVVAWDEAALADGGETDRDLRRLLRGALARAGVAHARVGVRH
jgi:hypothetical protein